MKYYRYRPIDIYSEDIISKREIYFASPKQFNDPFEMEFLLHFEASINEKRKYLEDSPFYNFRKEFKKAGEEKVNEFLSQSFSPSDVETIREEFRNKYLEFGILCLADNPKNIGMWAHYGGNHQGICFEFEFNENYFGECFKVDYQLEAPAFNYFEHLVKPRETFIKRLATTKAKCWEHEQEYRFILSQPVLVKFLPHNLTGAYLGMNVDKNNKIFKLMSDFTPDLPLYFLGPSKAKYSFDVIQGPITAQAFYKSTVEQA